MRKKHNAPTQLSGLPSWRLLVALADAEREAELNSVTARTLPRAIKEHWQKERDESIAQREPKGPTDAK